MSGKSLKKIAGGATGLFFVFAVYQWPDEKVPVQMALYSAMALVPLIFAFWRYRSSGRIWLCVLLAPVLHAAALFSIRSVFPFRSVLEVVPIALIESVALFALFSKLLGLNKDEDANQTSS